jgi:hypothetical protein
VPRAASLCARARNCSLLASLNRTLRTGADVVARSRENLSAVVLISCPLFSCRSSCIRVLAGIVCTGEASGLAFWLWRRLRVLAVVSGKALPSVRWLDDLPTSSVLFVVVSGSALRTTAGCAAVNVGARLVENANCLYQCLLCPLSQPSGIGPTKVRCVVWCRCLCVACSSRRAV